MIPPSTNSGVISDAYSKPLFIAPEERKIELAKSLSIDFYMIVMNNNKILISKEMSNYINWIDLDNEEIITTH